MGDSIIRKVDKIVNRGDDIIVCLPGAKIEDVAEKAGQVMDVGMGGAALVQMGTNNAEKEGTSAVVGKHRSLVKTLRVDMWLNFVGRDDFLLRGGLLLTGKGAAVLGCE